MISAQQARKNTVQFYELAIKQASERGKSFIKVQDQISGPVAKELRELGYVVTIANYCYDNCDYFIMW